MCVFNKAMVSELQTGNIIAVPSTHRKKQIKESGHAFQVDISRAWDAATLRQHLEVHSPFLNVSYLEPCRPVIADVKPDGKRDGFKQLKQSTKDPSGAELLAMYNCGTWFYMAQVNK